MEILDGGFGTMLQAAGLPAGRNPVDWNLENPSAVSAVHRAYVEAGAETVVTNTFGANRIKYEGLLDLNGIVASAVALAKECCPDNPPRVALDVGPTGRLLKPVGDLDFDDAFAAFSEEVGAGAAAGADMVLIETMGDLYELKAAVLAAKESADLPIYATVALGEDGKLLTGGTVEAFAALMESLDVAAYGFNCGLGPDQMLPFVERLAKVSSHPIIVKPNAGMPRLVDGRTVFPTGPEEFSSHMSSLVAAGASVIGGCCGTTPDHIRAIAELSPCESVRKTCQWHDDPHTVVSSGTAVVELRPHAGAIIGERINPTGKRLLKEAYAKGDVAYVLREAVKQIEAGADMLDVNCGVPGLDESALLDSTIRSVQSVATCPIQIDTADAFALAGAIRHVNGKPLVNSVNGKRESMDAVFPLVKRFGGAIVALCLDEAGIPPTVEGRLEIARKILREGRRYGFSKNDFVFDALTLSVSADPKAAMVTLETVRRLTEELKVNTVLGVSNVSFGLPNRPILSNAMYALAKRAGLSAAIANPAVIRDEIDQEAEDVLLGRDENCARWIARAEGAAKCAASPAEIPAAGDLETAIRRGLREDASSVARAELAAGKTPLEIIERGIVPALEEVGRGFETGTVFLPQLLMSADAAGEAFAVVKTGLESASMRLRTPSSPSRPIVLATVKGDIHDIGKNIVRALLENYGFEVIDLGRDVPPDKIVETARKTGAGLVGLSALMTTTVGAMAETIRCLKASGLRCKTVVGGAVVTEEYAESIGADFYAKDAMKTVRIAERAVTLPFDNPVPCRCSSSAFPQFEHHVAPGSINE